MEGVGRLWGQHIALNEPLQTQTCKTNLLNHHAAPLNQNNGCAIHPKESRTCQAPKVLGNQWITWILKPPTYKLRSNSNHQIISISPNQIHTCHTPNSSLSFPLPEKKKKTSPPRPRPSARLWRSSRPRGPEGEPTCCSSAQKWCGQRGRSGAGASFVAKVGFHGFWGSFRLKVGEVWLLGLAYDRFQGYISFRYLELLFVFG